jgi:hypothetical protein
VTTLTLGGISEGNDPERPITNNGDAYLSDDESSHRPATLPAWRAVSQWHQPAAHQPSAPGSPWLSYRPAQRRRKAHRGHSCSVSARRSKERPGASGDRARRLPLEQEADEITIQPPPGPAGCVLCAPACAARLPRLRRRVQRPVRVGEGGGLLQSLPARPRRLIRRVVRAPVGGVRRVCGGCVCCLESRTPHATSPTIRPARVTGGHANSASSMPS